MTKIKVTFPGTIDKDMFAFYGRLQYYLSKYARNIKIEQKDGTIEIDFEMIIKNRGYFRLYVLTALEQLKEKGVQVEHDITREKLGF